MSEPPSPGAMAASLPAGAGAPPPASQQEQEALGGEGEEAPQKRKATSFKITNVFPSRPPSNDGGDSCEDGEELEDSRTEVRKYEVEVTGIEILNQPQTLVSV